MEKKRKFKMPSAFTILFLLIFAVAGLSIAFAGADAGMCDLAGDGVIVPCTVEAASLSDVIMAPVGGLADALDIVLFVLVIGGFLGVVTKTGALEAGIQRLVKGSQGRENVMIATLMILFALGGTTYGMAEETIAFYGIVGVAMIAAGFDAMVVLGMILVGAGVGTLASTLNPFAVGAAMDAGGFTDATLIYLTSAITWVIVVSISIWFVIRYATKVKNDPSKTVLTKQEVINSEAAFKMEESGDLEFTGKHKVVLFLFGLSFVVMMLGIIPWDLLGVYTFVDAAGNPNLFGTGFEGIATTLFGNPLGWWWFNELSMWFLIMSIIIGIVAWVGEENWINSFIGGAADLLSVALIIALARGISVLMAQTHLDGYILAQMEAMLVSVSSGVYLLGTYLSFIGLSFLIPSTSGLASVAMPVFGPLSVSVLGETAAPLSVNAFAFGSGIVNLITPTSGVVMGALAITKVGYGTYLKWIAPLLGILFVVSIVMLVFVGPMLANLI